MYTKTSQELRIDKLCDALDIIGEFESGDSVLLKQAIRNEIARLEDEEDLASLIN